MTRNSWIALAILAVITSVFGIVLAVNQSNVADEHFQGQWTLTDARDSAGDINVSSKAVVLTVDRSTVSGSVCNSFGGSYTLQGTTLHIDSISSTEMWCESPEGIMDLETRFLNALAASNTVRFEGTTLVLTGVDIRLEFAQSTPD